MNHCRLPDKLLPPALHSCVLRDNGLRCLSAQVQAGGVGVGVCRVLEVRWGAVQHIAQALQSRCHPMTLSTSGKETYICKSLCLQIFELNPTGEEAVFCR